MRTMPALSLTGARVEALHLGLVAPRLALGKKAAAAATR
jgi:hypothetical protein